MRLGRLVLLPVHVAARSGRGMFGDEAERVIDGVLDGPLPEAVARSLVEHQIIERVAAEMMETASAEGRSGDQLEALIDRVLRSPALERWAAGGDAARLVEPLADRVLRSAAFKETMLGLLASPELRRALSGQTAGFGAEVAAGARARTARADDAVEAGIHSRLRLPRADTQPRRFAGFGTRAVALVIDVGLAQAAFLVGVASIGLVASLAGASTTGPLASALAASAWLLVSAAYFTGFWTVAGQTPGMRLMRIRVVTLEGAPLSAWRSILRFAGLLLAIVPLFAGFLTVLFDRRRRALQDFIARTVVVFEPRPGDPTGEIRPVDPLPKPVGSADPTATAGAGGG
jgi:uncharacterized RDD family membrane protein YckC